MKVGQLLQASEPVVLLYLPSPGRVSMCGLGEGEAAGWGRLVCASVLWGWGNLWWDLGGWNEWEKRVHTSDIALDLETRPYSHHNNYHVPHDIGSPHGAGTMPKTSHNGNPGLWSRERGDKKWTKLVSGPFLSRKGLAGFGISGQKSVIDELGPRCCHEISAGTTEQGQFVKKLIQFRCLSLESHLVLLAKSCRPARWFCQLAIAGGRD